MTATLLKPTEPPAWYLNSRKKAGLNQRWFFDAKGRPHINNWHHQDWFRLAEQYDRVLIEASREHSKTQVFAITQPLAEMALDTNVRILLISDVHEKSQERCRVLREHIEKNPAYRRDCPDVRITRKDGDHKFWIERDKYWLKEATVTSTYSGAPVSGGRYDLIIVDDLVNYLLNANTSGKRQKMSRWWSDDVLNSVAEGGRVWVIGTHQHHDDLYEEIKRDPAFLVRTYPAVDEKDTGYGSLGYAERNLKHAGVTGDDAHVLWPQAHDYAEHMAKKDNPSTHDSYLRQQQQLAVATSGLVYRKALMDEAFERGKDVSYDPRATQFVGYDPGYAIRGAMLCIQETTGDRMEMWAEHSFTQVAPDDIASFMARHCLNHNVLVAFVDAADLGFRLALEQKLSSIGATTRVQKVPFGEFKTHAIQTTRWLLKSGLVAWKGESTTVHTPGRTRTEPSIFRREMLSYALKEGTDDEAVKADDHGPDAWVAYTSRWIRYYLRAMGEEAA